LIYILLNNKSEHIYELAFQKCVEIFNLNPKNIISDFEIGLINATKKIWQCTINNGCFFHFSQAVWRNIQSFKLVEEYKNNQIFKCLVRKMMCLAFLNEKDIDCAWIILKEKMLQNKREGVESFIQYFEKTWIGLLESDVSKEQMPIFSKKLWNVRERVLSGLPRTSNNAEGWHSSLNKKSRCCHPNIAYLIQIMLNVEELNRIEIIQLKSGCLSSQNKKYKKEYNLFTIIKNQNFWSVEKFLDLIAAVYGFEYLENE
jgi:hypothetical protein